jgi:hypothetical protein
MLRRVALVRTDVSEEPSASFIRVTRIGEIGTTQAVPPKRRFLQEPHGVTSEKTPFFIDTVVKPQILQSLITIKDFTGQPKKTLCGLSYQSSIETIAYWACTDHNELLLMQ